MYLIYCEHIFFHIFIYMTLQFPEKQSQYTLSNNKNCLTEDNILTLVPFTNFIIIFRVSQQSSVMCSVLN